MLCNCAVLEVEQMKMLTFKVIHDEAHCWNEHRALLYCGL